MLKDKVEYWDLTEIKKVISIKDKEIKFKDLYGLTWTGEIVKTYKKVGYDIYIY
jgi:hypothetical protein